MRNLRAILVSGLLVLVFSAVALAQSGSIAGTVTDSTGAVVPDAEVIARNVGPNTVRSTTTNGAGVFSLTDLVVGTYEITVTKPSFKMFHVTAVELTVAQSITLNAKLEAGAASEEVQVRGDQVADIDLETSQVSDLVDSRKVQDLPLITRDPYSLVLLSPGTVQTNGNGGFSVNGSRDRNNNFMLDGTDNNDTSVPGGPSGGALGANPDSTEEFRVITSNFNAEFGRNTGAVIDVITKSGTNQFHGDAYEYGRWNGFGGARDWFNPSGGPNGGPQNPYVRNQFGYSIGGPIRKDKTFFFFNEEFDRFRTATTGSATVPTAAFKSGSFTYIDPNGLQVPIDLNQGSSVNAFNLPLDTTIQRVLALYPNPTSSNGDGYTGQINFPTGSKQNSYNTVAKIDEHFTGSETLSLRYGYDHFVDPDPFHDDVLPGGVGSTAEKSIGEALSANLTSVLRPNLINNFIFGWNHIYAAFACNHTVLDSAGTIDEFGNGTDYTFDPFNSFGCLSLGDSNGQDRKTGTVSYADSVSWVHGNHTFKFGGDFRDVGEGGDDNFFSRRSLTTDSPILGGPDLINFPTTVPGAIETVQLADAASALYGFVLEDFNSEFFNKAGVRQGSDNKLFRQHEYDGFAQDMWKVRSNLTLNLGLRYQFDSVPYEEGANLSNLLGDPASFAAGQDVVLSLVGPGTGHKLYKDDWSGIEPRIGFSWDPKGDGKTAIRGAFGIFHDRVFGNLFGNARGNPPFEQDYFNEPFQTVNSALPAGSFGGATGGPLPLVVPNTTPSAVIPDGSQLAPVLFDPNFRNPVSDSWNLGIQRQLPGNITVDVAYVASKGTHIFRAVNGNPQNPALVNQLLAICNNTTVFTNAFGDPTTCAPTDVTKGNIFNGFDNGILPFNAVANNALNSPDLTRSIGNSNYNSLQLKVTRRMTHGLEIQGSYTYSHGIDDSGDPLVPGGGNRSFPRDSLDLAQERGNSDSDIRHAAVFNYIWEMPIGKGQNYLNHGVVGRVFEGLQLAGITSLHGGLPFDVYSTTDSQRSGLSNRADLLGDPFAAGVNPNASPSTKTYFSNIDAFGQPAYGGPGNIGRNREYGPGFVDFDVALSKKMAITERVAMELKMEGYNIFNRPQFTNPGTDPNAFGNQLGSPLFGLITGTQSNPDSTTSARQLQVSLKLSF
ncbi:MAG TPA: carboxypeptidase-like regulatory domain-containing protein [Terriglobales bacterium]|nr:carboxypeptidase-like regulatory domain-containing protein [Terriglobales bacterium]